MVAFLSPPAVRAFFDWPNSPWSFADDSVLRKGESCCYHGITLICLIIKYGLKRNEYNTLYHDLFLILTLEWIGMDGYGGKAFKSLKDIEKVMEEKL